jgi:hypothetical protein
MVAGQEVSDAQWLEYNEAWERNWPEVVELWGIATAALRHGE